MLYSKVKSFKIALLHRSSGLFQKLMAPPKEDISFLFKTKREFPGFKLHLKKLGKQK